MVADLVASLLKTTIKLAPLGITADHRYVDGWHISRAMKAFRGYLEDPAAFEPELRAG